MAPLDWHLDKFNPYWKPPSGKHDIKSSSIVISPRVFVGGVNTGHRDPDYPSAILYIFPSRVCHDHTVVVFSLHDVQTISDCGGLEILGLNGVEEWGPVGTSL